MPDYIIIIKATTTVHDQSHMHVHITMNDRPIGDLKTSACIHIYRSQYGRTVKIKLNFIVPSNPEFLTCLHVSDVSIGIIIEGLSSINLNC